LRAQNTVCLPSGTNRLVTRAIGTIN